MMPRPERIRRSARPGPEDRHPDGSKVVYRVTGSLFSTSSGAARDAVEARCAGHGATVGVTGLDERGARPHGTLTGEPAGRVLSARRPAPARTPHPVAASRVRPPRATENWSVIWASASAVPGATARVPSSRTTMSLSRVNQPWTIWAAPMELSTGRRA
ncbi:hypothetical protein EV284_0110 [Streptomyces sp. BK022]|nr:hypothetical protein EV284_0110 [Streptomyces sp. BK022]